MIMATAWGCSVPYSSAFENYPLIERILRLRKNSFAAYGIAVGAVVLATGVRERAIPFPGWTLPGVMFAGGAQAILKAQRTSPGRIAVVAGCGPLPIVVASQLTRAGTRVAALASLRSPLAFLRSPGGLWHGRDIMGEGVRYGRSLLCAGTAPTTMTS